MLILPLESLQHVTVERVVYVSNMLSASSFTVGVRLMVVLICVRFCSVESQGVRTEGGILSRSIGTVDKKMSKCMKSIIFYSLLFSDSALGNSELRTEPVE
jgi:hypothetical protein